MSNNWYTNLNYGTILAGAVVFIIVICMHHKKNGQTLTDMFSKNLDFAYWVSIVGILMVVAMGIYMWSNSKSSAQSAADREINSAMNDVANAESIINQ